MTPEEQYQKDKESHDAFIRGYKAAIRDAERHSASLDGFDMIGRLIKFLNSECSMRESFRVLPMVGHCTTEV